MSLQHCCWTLCQIAIKTKFPGIIDIIGTMSCLFYMKCFTHAALCILKGDVSLEILSTDASGCFVTNVTFTAVAEIGIRGKFCESYHTFNLFFVHLILFWIDELIHFYSIYMSSMNIEFYLWYENCRRLFQMYIQWKCLNFDYTLHWRHNDHNGVSNHQPHCCLLNCLYRRSSKKTSKLCATDLCMGNSPGPVNSPHKGPVTRKMFPFDEVIMNFTEVCSQWSNWL